MYEIATGIEFKFVEELETFFYEEGLVNWAIIEEKEGGGYILKGFFEEQDQAKEGYEFLCGRFDFLDKGLIDQVVELDDNKWQNAYKEFIKPWSYKDLSWVPSWMKQEYQLREGESILWLDAGMAFGTGAHETTQLCGQGIVDYCENLSKDELSNIRLIDAGCGSGILGLSAYLNGIKDVMAFDIDPEVIGVCQDNARQNGLEGAVNFEVGGLEDYLSPADADVLVANILAPVLKEHAPLLVECVRPGGVLILSGILNEEAQGVCEAYEKAASGREFSYAQRSQGDWSSLEFKFS